MEKKSIILFVYNYTNLGSSPPGISVEKKRFISVFVRKFTSVLSVADSTPNAGVQRGKYSARLRIALLRSVCGFPAREIAHSCLENQKAQRQFNYTNSLKRMNYARCNRNLKPICRSSGSLLTEDYKEPDHGIIVY
ncbi:hypothetical protein AVEN_858-1 [Araneus ventricosus]|uniref:Uncharacterized protein n=1 Tax=Araneus ventricosus TaxID=182803 RepID=A0A4Y2NX76_ARAVE|nr:hypothetical protein AVEN_858-1 [Araneus ventricosus]